LLADRQHVFPISAPAALNARQGLSDWNRLRRMVPRSGIRDQDYRGENHEGRKRKNEVDLVHASPFAADHPFTALWSTYSC